MRSAQLLLLLLLFLFLTGGMTSSVVRAQNQTGPAAREVVGTWEGESKCMVPGSPCHDEHVIYRFTSSAGDPEAVKLDAYKVVNGEREFMGTLSCRYESSNHILTCSGHTRQQDVWEFTVTATNMQGTLKVGEQRQLYRKIQVQKKPNG